MPCARFPKRLLLRSVSASSHSLPTDWEADMVRVEPFRLRRSADIFAEQLRYRGYHANVVTTDPDKHGRVTFQVLWC